MAARLSRRTLLAGSASLGVLAACGGGTSAVPSATPSRTATVTTARTPASTATPTPTAPPPAGTLRLQSPGALSFDTFDAARSGSFATLEVLGRTHSRLVEYRDSDFSAISGDLAASWEQPEANTFVFTIRGDARWHDVPPLNGRAVTAEDVAASLTRTIEIAASEVLPIAQRSSDWRLVESIDAPSTGTVRVRLKEFDPFVLNTLAGAFALVQPPEVAAQVGATLTPLDPALAVGSGPFVFEGVDSGVRFAANMAGHYVPRVERLVVSPPADPVAAIRAVSAHEVELHDRRDIDAVESDPGQAVQRTGRFADHAIMSTMFAGALPWNDLRLRQALALALDRRVLVERLAGGLGAAARVAYHAEPFAFTLPERTPSLLPPVTEARALWEAGGGPALGAVTIDFPSVFDPRYSASSVVVELLTETLGGQFQAAIQPYTEISRKQAEHAYGAGSAAFWFGWGPRFLDPEPSRHLFETYHSSGPNAAATGFASTEVDSLLEQLVATPAEERGETGRAVLQEIEREAGGGIIAWYRPIVTTFRWPFLSRPPRTTWHDQFLDRFAAVDTAHPGYRAT